MRTRRGGHPVEPAEVGMSEATDNAPLPLEVMEKALVLLAAFFRGLQRGRGGGREGG